ncbi:MAG: tRNA 5-methoxyuridine(34)/uridine 5-oxyacetic acid(34) synthase CmoB [Gammaproteobacteria bacterium]|nr:tRNA 5-methoxyuridine(34)/uridine 5-oxyacetic acid(34) synthase CmoB [Gammaproteobacteria bacterium]
MLDFNPLHAIIDGTPLAQLQPFLAPEFIAQIKHGDLPRWQQLLAVLPALSASVITLGDTITIGSETDIDASQRAEMEQALRAFIPWRKGPFNVFGIHIDTEWQSQLKWQRVAHAITPLAGRKVLDVGSGNGYYGFRMLEAGAALVLGIDPHIAYVAQFWAIKQYTPKLPLFVLPLTLEQIPTPLPHFDTIFSMGVLYHRRSPLDHLQQLRECLRSGGELVLETLYVDGDEGYSLVPASRYARMSNVWFVPSIKTLVRWLMRSRFGDIQIIDESVTSLQEQRKTDWMPFNSLQDALDPSNPELTIENYPAPKRVVVIARAL